MRRLSSIQMAFDWRLLHISEQVSDVLFEGVSPLLCIKVNYIKYLTKKRDPLEVEKIRVRGGLYLIKCLQATVPLQNRLGLLKTKKKVSCLK